MVMVIIRNISDHPLSSNSKVAPLSKGRYRAARAGKKIITHLILGRIIVWIIIGIIVWVMSRSIAGIISWSIGLQGKELYKMAKFQVLPVQMKLGKLVTWF